MPITPAGLRLVIGSFITHFLRNFMKLSNSETSWNFNETSMNLFQLFFELWNFQSEHYDTISKFMKNVKICPYLWNLVKLSKMKFHETSEIIFNFKNLWNFLPLIIEHHLQKHAYRRLQQSLSLVNVFYKYSSRNDDAQWWSCNSY